jgi:hypothetical protein
MLTQQSNDEVTPSKAAAADVTLTLCDTFLTQQEPASTAAAAATNEACWLVATSTAAPAAVGASGAQQFRLLTFFDPKLNRPRGAGASSSASSSSGSAALPAWQQQQQQQQQQQHVGIDLLLQASPYCACAALTHPDPIQALHAV